MSEPDIILYDGDCGFCDWCRNLVKKHDPNKQFQFIPMQDNHAQEIAHRAGHILDSTQPDSFVLYRPSDNQWLETIPAARVIIKHTRYPLKFVYYLLVITPLPLAETVYHWIARHRPFLGRLVGKGVVCRIDN